MSQSIYELLDSLETETSVPMVKGKDGQILRRDYGMVKHYIPGGMVPTSEEFENEEKLLAWAKVHGVLHQMLQTGIQGRIIELRAKFKSMRKGETWTKEKGQENIDSAEWKVVTRPKSGKTESDESVATKFLASLTPEQRAEFMAKLK